MEDNDNDIELIDSENYRGSGKDEPLSHSALVNIAMKRCLEARQNEMREGYTTLKRDKMGNQIPIYIPDTRKVFIECVEGLKMIMGSDIDEETQKKLDEIETSIKEKFNNYVQLEEQTWRTSHYIIKQQWFKRGIIYMSEKLAQGLPYYTEFLLDKVGFYTTVFTILDKRAKVLNYFKEEDYEA
jgi:hypothetical protein